MFEQQFDYDYFMYVEDDILVPKQAIEYWLKYSPQMVQNKYNLGFVRIEKDDMIGVQNILLIYRIRN